MSEVRKNIWQGDPLEKKTVIPSVQDLRYLDKALEADSPIVLLSNADIGVLQAQVATAHQHGKLAFAHLELIGGFSPDTKGMKLLRNMYHLDGVFTTNLQAASMASQLGLYVVYRFFLLDSLSVKRTLRILQGRKTESIFAIEFLPAVCALTERERLRNLAGKTRFLAGGLIRDEALIGDLFAHGFSGVTTSVPDLWQYRS